MASPKASSLDLDAEPSLGRTATQGRTAFGVDVCAQRHNANFGLPEERVGDGGWFPTDDVGVRRRVDPSDRDPRWGDRPMLVVAACPGCEPDPLDARDFYEGKVPKWSFPNRVVIAA